MKKNIWIKKNQSENVWFFLLFKILKLILMGIWLKKNINMALSNIIL